MLTVMRIIICFGSLVTTVPLLAADLPTSAPQDLYLQTALQAAKDVKVAKSEALTLGAWFERRGRHVYIRDFYADSPAVAAGLKRGDQILAVDGRDDQVMNHLMQLPHGKAVTIKYRRLPWSEPETVKVIPKSESLHQAWLASTRDSVSWFPIGNEQKGAGYMRVWGATDATQVAIAEATYASVLRKQPKVIVLDLRGPQSFDRSELCDELKDAFAAKAAELVILIDRNSGNCRLQTAVHLRTTQQARIVGEPGMVTPDLVVKDQLIFAAGHDNILRAALLALDPDAPAAKK